MIRRLLLAVILGATVVVVVTTGSAPQAAAQVAPPVRVGVQLSSGTIAAFNTRHRTATLDSIPSLPGAYLVTSTAGLTADRLLIEILADPAVAFAEIPSRAAAPEVFETLTIRAWTASTPTAAGTQYANSLLRLSTAQQSSTGTGIVVAVLDSGVSAANPAIGGRVVAGFDAIAGGSNTDDRRDAIDNDGDGLIDEGAGHGTHVAGIVRRVAPGASIMPVRVLDSDGNGDSWVLASGLAWAADHGARVVNASVGGRGSHQFVKRALDLARRKGVTVVAAAGNDGRERENYPAGDDCVVAVTSSGASDRVSSFSTTGSWVAVTAPGEDIVSGYPFMASGYAAMSGTSMAAPFVAGQAALLHASKPLTPGAVQLAIRGTTVALVNPPRRAGTGRIDPVASLVAVSAGRTFDAKSLGMKPDCQ
jgi:subtilisin family serine protease